MTRLKTLFTQVLVLVVLLQSAQASSGLPCMNATEPGMDASHAMSMKAELAEHAGHHAEATRQTHDLDLLHCQNDCDCAGNCDQVVPHILLPSLALAMITVPSPTRFAAIRATPLLAHSHPPIRPPDFHQSI